MTQAKRFDIQLYGETYTIISDESEQKVLEIAKNVDELMRAIAQRTGSSDVKKIAVLTALKLATEQNTLASVVADKTQACLKLAADIEQVL